MSKPVKNKTKQLTFNNLPLPIKQDVKTKAISQKQICITQMETIIRIDELILKIGFKLEPSHRAFSKIKANLTFEDTKISSITIRVPQGSLGTNELEYRWIMDTKGIAEGTYHIKVEMHEEWTSNEKLYQTSHTIVLNYVPQTRHSRLIKIPFIKKVTGADIIVVSDQEKQLYTDIERTVKTEQKSQQDT